MKEKKEGPASRSGRVEIVMDGHGLGQVFVDGERIPRVVGVQFNARAGGSNTLVLELLVEEATISCPEAFVLETPGAG